jgi:hypothetical protein
MYLRKAVLIGTLLSPIAAMCAEAPGLEIKGASIQVTQSPLGDECGQCTLRLESSQAIRVQVEKMFAVSDTGFMRQEDKVRVSFQGAREPDTKRLAPRKFHVQINGPTAGASGGFSIGGQILCAVIAHCYVR